MTDTTFTAGTIVEAAWLNDVNNLRYGASNPARGAALLQYYLNATTATARTAQAKMSDFVHIDDFGAVGDATTDDLVPLTRFFNSAIANPGVPHRLGNKIYACSGALPTINVSGVLIYGVPGGSHDVGTFSGSVIRAKTGNSGTMLTIAPDSGGSNQGLQGWRLDGVTFDCAGIASKGLMVKSSRYYYLDVYVANATTDGCTFGVVGTLGESADIQYGFINYRGRQVETPGGVSLRITGDTAANTSFNLFNQVDIIHKNASGIIEENADNNTWGVVRVFRAGGGSATNSIEWQGGASTAVGCRAEVFCQLSATVAAIAKGTGTYTVAANNIRVQNLDVENGTPAPTVETGASVAGVQIAWTPTVTSGSGTLTTVSASGYYQIDAEDTRYVDFRLAVSITTNGTGATDIRATLPFTSTSDGVGSAIAAYDSTASLALAGYVGVGVGYVRILKYDGTYPGADGKSLQVTGRYRRA